MYKILSSFPTIFKVLLTTCPYFLSPQFISQPIKPDLEVCIAVTNHLIGKFFK